MPRANRYIQPGHIYHITHRCHNRNFLLRYELDRTEYCSRLRVALRKHQISLFDFCVTCNHIHLLCMCDRLGDLSRFMQQLQGEFAEHYNIRTGRSGAFWGERFHSTMVDCGEYLWNCLCYIDLNMVRAGVIRHPNEWPWCGYRELTGKRKRYRLLQVDRLVNKMSFCVRRRRLALTQGARRANAWRCHFGACCRQAAIQTVGSASGGSNAQTGNRIAGNRLQNKLIPDLLDLGFK